jgi:8-oxo-dGTP pyrophosphatase MutT (NUDIX family)
MSFLEKINRCNRYDRSRFLPLMVENVQVGQIRDDLLPELSHYPQYLIAATDSIELSPELKTDSDRTEAFNEIVDDLINRKVIDRRYGEIYPVFAQTRDTPFFQIDRGVASYFGIRTFGQHVNGYVRKADGYWLWIGRRSMDKPHEPGKLDHIVAGGLPFGLSLKENLRKECEEEAGIEAALADTAIPVGIVSYVRQNERGLKPDTLYCYDLELSQDFQPVCQDGEVDEFMLLPVDEVTELVRDTDEFKLNCNLVIIDFLIRHGLISPEEPDYQQLARGLRQ